MNPFWNIEAQYMESRTCRYAGTSIENIGGDSY